MDILLGIGAIVMVAVIWLMRESENKYIAYLGFGIVLIAKLMHSV